MVALSIFGTLVAIIVPIRYDLQRIGAIADIAGQTDSALGRLEFEPGLPSGAAGTQAAECMTARRIAGVPACHRRLAEAAGRQVTPDARP